MLRTAGLKTPTNCAYITVSADCKEIANHDYAVTLVLHAFLDRFQFECECLDYDRKFDVNPWFDFSHEDIHRETLRFVPVEDVQRCVNALIDAGLLDCSNGSYQFNADEFNRRVDAIPGNKLDYSKQPTLFDNSEVQ